MKKLSIKVGENNRRHRLLVHAIARGKASLHPTGHNVCEIVVDGQKFACALCQGGVVEITDGAAHALQHAVLKGR